MKNTTLTLLTFACILSTLVAARTPKINPEISGYTTINGSGFGIQHQVTGTIMYKNKVRLGGGMILHRTGKLEGWSAEAQYIAVNFENSYTGATQLYFKAAHNRLQNVPMSAGRASYEQMSAKNFSGMTDYDFKAARYNVSQTSVSAGLAWSMVKHVAVFGEVGLNYHQMKCCNFQTIVLAQRDRSLSLQVSAGVRFSLFAK